MSVPPDEPNERNEPEWTGPERWQVILAAASLLVAVIALAR